MKRNIKIIIVLMIVIIFGLAIYFCRSRWVHQFGMEGEYSKETYLNGGSCEISINEDIRVWYSIDVKQGGLVITFMTPNNELFKKIEFTESQEGWITFNNKEEVICQLQTKALSADSIVHEKMYVEKRMTNFEVLVEKINEMMWYLRKML